MSEDTAPVSATSAAPTPKKKAKPAAKKPRAAPSHPKVADMVNDAITTLKERGGSSLQAIKKHVGSHHKVDIDRLTPFIKKYLKAAVASGTLIQTKGKGASGSFKLSASGQKTKDSDKAKKPKKESASPAKKAKTAAAKKPTKPKTAKATDKKKPAAKKPAAAKKAAKPKSPAKKVSKATKPKSPKVKKLKTPKKAAPKKAKK